MARPKLSVAVVGSQSPDRSVILSELLLDSIERHGWGERIGIVSVGFGAGAGETDRRMLQSIGLRPAAASHASVSSVPDVEEDSTSLEESDAVVVATGEDAERVIAWPELEAKQVFALSDYLGDDGWAVEDPASMLGDYVAQVKEGVPHLLRALIAQPD